jgi:gamma-glutamylcyclotransferase
LERHEVTFVKYFAYGSNMDPLRMKEREVRYSQRVHAVLRGYVLKFNKAALGNPREGKGSIVPDANDTVEGALYEMPDSDLAKLDEKEGYPDHYDRISVMVELDDHSTVQAITYIAQPSMIREDLKPKRKYLNHYLAGEDILSKPYFEKLRSTETLD